MKQEEWVQIEGADNAFISSYGRVKRNGVIVKPKLSGGGYPRVNVGGKIGRDRVHRIVAKYFVPNPFGKKIVNHRDGNRQNNKTSNLEWCTHRENSLCASLKGQLSKSGGKKRKIIAEEIQSGEETEFESQAEASRVLKIPDCEINKALRGERKTSHGYKFRYAAQN